MTRERIIIAPDIGRHLKLAFDNKFQIKYLIPLCDYCLQFIGKQLKVELDIVVSTAPGQIKDGDSNNINNKPNSLYCMQYWN